MALTVTSSSDCQDLQRPELPASATVCLELCTAVEDQRPQADLVAAAHQAKEEGVQRGREEGEGDHLSARGAMVLPAEPSKGQNHGGVVALACF
jgi:hypothetical protein